MAECWEQHTLSPEDIQAILAELATIREQLPQLVHLTPEQRATLPVLGEQEHTFLDHMLLLARCQPDLLPPSLNVDKMAQTVALYESLRLISLHLTQLHQSVYDTLEALNRKLERSPRSFPLPDEMAASDV